MMGSCVAFVADVHIHNFKAHGGPLVAGINCRCQLVLDTLARAVAEANKRGCEAFVVLGDLFDTDHPTPQILTATREVLAKFRGALGVFPMVGNHDQSSTAIGDHAFGPLRQRAATRGKYGDTHNLVCPVYVVEEPLNATGSVMLVPYMAGNVSEYLPRALDEVCTKTSSAFQPRILGLHMGIKDAGTPPWLRDVPNSIDADVLALLMQQHGIVQCFAGDWHAYRKWRLDTSTVEERAGRRDYADRQIVQVGTLCPAGWDDAGTEGYGSLIIADGETWERVEIPGPRFVMLSDDDPAMPAENDGCSYFVRVVVPASSLALARDRWIAATDARGNIEALEVVADEKEQRAVAAKAAAAAQGATTLNEAVTEYVGAMPLEDGVDRTAVLDRVQEYLT